MLCASLSVIFLQTTDFSETRQPVELQIASSQPETPQCYLLTPPQSLPYNSYIKLRRKVLTDGVEALPAPSPPAAVYQSTLTLENLLISLSQS